MSDFFLKKDNPYIIWILSIITFGIYNFIYIYKISKELNSLNKDDNKYPKLEYLTFIAIAGFVLTLIAYGRFAYPQYFNLHLMNFGVSLHSFNQSQFYSRCISSCVLMLYPYYKIAENIKILEDNYNVSKNKCNKIFVVLLYFCFYYNTVYIQSHMNNLILCIKLKNNE